MSSGFASPASTRSRRRWASSRASAWRHACVRGSSPRSTPSTPSASQPAWSVSSSSTRGPQPRLRRGLAALAQGDEVRAQARREGGVDRLEDLPATAEVRRQRRDPPDGRERRAVGAEEVDVGVAKAVDRLLLVSHDEQVVAVQRTEQRELALVGVLELVDHDAVEALGVGAPQRRLGVEQVAREELEVVEVQRRALALERRHRHRRSGPAARRAARPPPPPRGRGRRRRRPRAPRGSPCRPRSSSALAPAPKRSSPSAAAGGTPGCARSSSRQRSTLSRALPTSLPAPAIASSRAAPAAARSSSTRSACGSGPGATAGSDGPRLAGAAQRVVRRRDHPAQAVGVVGGDEVQRRGAVLAVEHLGQRALPGAVAQRPRGGLVEHAERRIEARGDRVGAQQPRAEAVDRRDPRRLGLARLLALGRARRSARARASAARRRRAR